MAAETANIAIGLGSQRASLEAGTSQSNLRKLAPKACLIGNIGGAQLASTNGIELAIHAVEDIEADGLAIHLNPLQEIIQPEGDHDWRGVERAIGMLVDRLDCPVLVKEVGAGLSAEVVGRSGAGCTTYRSCLQGRHQLGINRISAAVARKPARICALY